MVNPFAAATLSILARKCGRKACDAEWRSAVNPHTGLRYCVPCAKRIVEALSQSGLQTFAIEDTTIPQEGTT